MRANQLVTIDDLIELLWEQDPPGSSVNVIHRYIGAIRRLLEPDLEARANGRWLTRHGGGYRLAAGEDVVDLIAFRRMVKDARSASAAGRPAVALNLLMEAAGLRQGACGEGLEVYGRPRAHFSAVDQEYVSAVGEAAGAALACAQPGRVLPLLRQVAADEPLDESLHARLMLVLAACGQQAGALAHYQAVRERLSSDLGVDPGAEMRGAYSRVLRQEVPAAAAGTAVMSGSADAPLGRAIAISSSPGAPSPLVPPAQLPADLPVFTGREAELWQVAQMLSPDGGPPATAVCAIDGMAGIGKTTFAIHWAHRIAKHFADGQLYINLRGFDSGGSAAAPTDALHTLLCSLGVPTISVPDGVDARAGLYRSVLAGKRVLIVLDNARDVQQVRPLLPGSPGCLVIVTSRSLLTGLAMTDGARLLTLGLPSLATARQTLERRLDSGRVAAEPEAAEEIIGLCGRLPLALAIVSARAAANPGFTLASIAAELRRTRGRLDGFGIAGAATDARTVFSWSYRLLCPRACRLFRLLSLQAADSITAAASASLLGAPPDETSRLIAELTTTALLTEHQPGRYSFHDLIRAYAAELSESTDAQTERHEALARLLGHYLHSGHAAQIELRPHREPIAPAPPRPGVTPERFPDGESALSWFTAEHQVLNASVSLAAETDPGFPAWQLALTVQQFYHHGGLYRDWTHTMQIALQAAVRDADLPGQGHVLRSLAGAHFQLEQYDEAVRCLEQAKAIYTELGCTTEHGYLHASFGRVFYSQGKLQLALEHSLKALELYRQAGYRLAEADVLGEIGRVHGALGNYQEAMSYLECGITLAQQRGLPGHEAENRKQAGIVHFMLGQYGKAVEELRLALILFRRVGHRSGEATVLLSLEDALAAQGQQQAAEDARQQASSIASAFQLAEGESLPISETALAALLAYRTTGVGRPAMFH